MKHDPFCLTPDTRYTTEVDKNTIRIVAVLPKGHTFSRAEATLIEQHVHGAVENAISTALIGKYPEYFERLCLKVSNDLDKHVKHELTQNMKNKFDTPEGVEP